jgi:hypothetical protein
LQSEGDDFTGGGDQGKDVQAHAKDPAADEGEGSNTAQNVENVAENAIEDDRDPEV